MMKRPTFDDARALLPALDELRPVLDELVGTSVPDVDRTWSGSGVLGTAGTRLVDGAALEAELERLVAEEAAHLRETYRIAAEAVSALEAGAPADAARAFLRAFALEEGRDRPDRAEAWADAAVRVAETSRDDVLRSLALRRRGRARRAMARYAEGERDYLRSFEIATSIDDRAGAAEAAIGAGNLVEDEARWDEAERWYRTALDGLDGSVDPRPEQWHANLNLHVVQRARGELEESLAALDEAARLAGLLDDPSAAMFVENARGQWHTARGDFGTAERHLRAALGVAVGTRARVTIRLNLAEALLQGGRALDAAEEARRAEREAIAGRTVGELPEVYRILGRVAAGEGNQDAFVFFERALELIEARDLPRIQRARTLEAYGEVERSVGDQERAEALLQEAELLYERLGVDRSAGSAKTSDPAGDAG
jgi:tetratricopeptide (TPR) repeat protein